MTTIELVGADAIGFTDGNAGHVYTIPAGAPSAGDLDVLCVNSDTVVSTPAGFTLAPTAVTNQGAYIFRRKATGSEGDTVTITTTGNFNACLVWSRWRNTDVVDQTAVVQANTSFATTTPAVTTGALAAQNELVVAFAALHGITPGLPPTNPVWSAGYTHLATAPLVGDTGAGAGQCTTAYVGYRIDAGTAAETPAVSWTTSVMDRYMLVLTLTPDVSITATPAGADPAGTPADLTLAAGVTTITATPAGADPAGAPATTTTGTVLDATPGAALPAGTPARLDAGATTPPPAITAAVVHLTVTATVTVH